MNIKQKNKLILIILVFALIAINYSFFDKALTSWIIDSEKGVVERVIDGDTVKINNESVRLLGINSPEKGEYFYEESKKFLEKEISRKPVEIYFGRDKYDKYQRKLGYIYYKGKNINLKSVENGFSNFYFPSGKDKYYSKFLSAWDKCLSKNINLCEHSKDVCKNCIQLEKWNVENQIVILKNSCDFNCDLTNWEIKDEGRKKFTFTKTILKKDEEIKISAEDFNKDYVWTKTGDSIFLRDSGGKLIFWDYY